MHTTYVKTRSGEYTILHNSDWSGDVEIRGPAGRIFQLPGADLVALGRAAALDVVRSAVIATLENLE